MKELAEILQAYDELTGSGARCAMATVVGVRGSSYRKPGARMLVAEDGRTWGGISGGCLERDVARRALAVIETARPVICRYDTADEQEDGFGPIGPALGCHGVIDIFVEAIAPSESALPPQLQALDDACRRRRVHCSATLLRAQAGSGMALGCRVSLSASGSLSGSSDGAAPVGVIAALRAAPQQRIPCTISVPGSGDWFIETLRPPQRVICFGSGPDVVPVISIGQSLGWHVHVVATGPAPRAAERFSRADRLLINQVDDLTRGLTLEGDDAVILMTHNYPRDARILERILLEVHPVYLGILGPRHRTERLLAETGLESRIDRSRLHAPIGLDLGAQNPEQIALAIIAEITATVNQASGFMLRDLGRKPNQEKANAPLSARVRRSDRCPT